MCENSFTSGGLIVVFRKKWDKGVKFCIDQLRIDIKCLSLHLARNRKLAKLHC
jgi:hypothetical protein